MESETPAWNNPVFDRSKGLGYFKQFELSGLFLLDNHPLFRKAIESIPKSDVLYVKKFETLHSLPPKSEKDIAHMLASIRWTNPICEKCLDKKDPGALFACERCGLGFYCSTGCQEAHLPIHSLRCCNPDGPLDNGPFQIVFGSFAVDKKPS
jgi:hypothetical protein